MESLNLSSVNNDTGSMHQIRNLKTAKRDALFKDLESFFIYLKYFFERHILRHTLERGQID